MDIKRLKRLGLRALTGLLLIHSCLLLVRSYQPDLLEQVRESGELRVLSRNGPTTYYEGPKGYTGFEYTLLKGFAEDLGVELVIMEEPSLGKMFSRLTNDTREHLAAANITVTPKRSKRVLFTQPFIEVQQQVIYHSRHQSPREVVDLMGRDLVVIAQSAHVERLKELRETYPELSWREIENVEMIDLMEMVHKGEADAAIVDSHAFELNRYAYARVRAGFALTGSQQLAWAFPRTGDTSLYQAAETYLSRIKDNGQLAAIQERFFQPMPVEEVDTADALAFMRRLEQRFPRWEEDIRAAGEEFEVDWALLAAISYQESHWDPKAVSPTGVRGLMMLTRATASEVGVDNRIDPTQSIFGGARYFRNLLDRIPARVTDPEDRLYMALAAYNVGMGHLEDARVLTERHGDDPNKWTEVRKYLPLLSKRQYFSQTKHGYARGWEPVHYVRKVRSYHRILAWYAEQEERRLAVLQFEDQEDNQPQAQLQEVRQLSLQTSSLSVL